MCPPIAPSGQVMIVLDTDPLEICTIIQVVERTDGVASCHGICLSLYGMLTSGLNVLCVLVRSRKVPGDENKYVLGRQNRGAAKGTSPPQWRTTTAIAQMQ